jgi:hypothetical protein
MMMIGCGHNADVVLPPDDPPDAGVDGSISFENEETLLLAPGETVDIGVVTTPAAAYSVSFYLAGDGLDASLDQSQVVTDPSSGKAKVKLRAPNSATNFVVRATIKDGPAADLAVSVSDQGFGTLQITPVYGGKRALDQWLGRVVSGTTCEALAETFPDDPEGALIGSADPEEPLVITGAPVGPNLTVFVRAGHYMWGCRDEADLVAGETTPLEVNIVNKPIVLDEAHLDIELDFAPDPVPWQTIVDDGKALLMSDFFGGYQSTAELLLDTMSSLAGDQNAFDLAATNGSWLTTIEAHLATYSVDIQQSLSDLMDSGLAKQPELIVGNVDAFEQAPGHALFTLKRIGTVDAAQAGVPAEYVTTLTVDPDDTVRLGGSLFWLPSRYLGVVTSQEGLAQNPQATDFEQALAEIVQCDDLVLAGYTGCDATCMAQLCHSALAARWAEAVDASATSYLWGDVPFEASGKAQFDDLAALTGFEGTWLGQISSGQLNASVAGAVVAETPDNPPAE